MNPILDDILTGLAFAGNVLDTPWAAVRTAIADQDVGAGLESIVDWDKRASGKEMLNSLFGEFQGDELAGIAAEILPDMLVPGMGAYKLLRRFRGAPALAEAAPESRGFLDAIDKAVPVAHAPEAIAEPELMRLLGSNPIIESAEAMPRGLPAPVPDAPAYYSRLRNAVEALPGERFKSQSVVNQLNKVAPEGFSKEELQWSRLNDVLAESPAISKAELLDALDESTPRYSPQWKKLDPLAGNIDDRPHYKDYSTGTGDYQEWLAQADLDSMSGGDVFSTPHFPGQGNPLLHVRAEMVTRPGGGKTLLANEIQSDWHQGGKSRGYQTSPYEIDPRWEQHKNGVLTGEGSLVIEPMTNGKVRLESKGTGMVELYDTVEEAKAAGAEKLKRMRPDERLPDAPFKEDWPLLGIKELIRQGVEQGADEVAWLPGERVQQMVHGEIAGQAKFYGSNLSPKALGEQVLQELHQSGLYAEDLSKSQAALLNGTLSPEEYGRQLLKSSTLEATANKYLKSRGWNTKVDRGHPVSRGSIKFDGEEATETATIPFRIKITPEMRADLRKRGQPLMSLAPFGLGGGLAASLFGRPQSPTPES